MKRKWMVAALMAGTVILATGCGEKKEETISGNKAETAQTEENGEAEEKTTALSVVTEGLSDEITVASPVIETEFIAIPEYKGIEVEKQVVEEVTEEDITAEIEGLLESMAEKKEVTDRTDVRDQDVVNIDYKGTKDGVAFDGGSYEGWDLTIGSGNFIPGFEEKLIGAKVGETLNLDLTFPEDYSKSPELAGQAVVFEVTINSISESVKPELTDALIAENTESKTVEEYKDFLRTSMKEERENTAKVNKQKALWSKMIETSAVKKYPKEDLDSYILDYKNYMGQMAASQYQMDLIEYLDNVGITEQQFEEDALVQAKSVVKEDLIFKAIAEKENLEIKEEDYQSMLKDYVANMGFEDEETMWKQIEENGMSPDTMKNTIRDNLLFMNVIEMLEKEAKEV